MATTRNISGNFTKLDGSAGEGLTGTITLLTKFAANTNEHVPTNYSVTVTGDASGDWADDVVVPDSGTWYFLFEGPDENRFRFWLGAGDPITLTEIINQASVGEVGSTPALAAYLPIASVLDEDDMASDSDVYPATQQSLKAYVDNNAGGGSLDGLSDTTIDGTPAEGEVLTADGADGWRNETLAEAGISATGHSHTESDISDLGTYLTDITGENIADLSDVVVTSVADNEVLAYDSGGNWINQTAAEAGLAAASHTHTESDITDLDHDTNEYIVIAVSDESTDLEAGTGKATFRMPYAMALSEVRASVTTAPTGSALTVDINESGSTILSTKLTIDATEKTSETAATPAVISDSALADNAEITIDIDAIGSSTAGAGLKVYLIGAR